MPKRKEKSMKTKIKAIVIKVYEHESIWQKIVHIYTIIIAIALIGLMIGSLLWNTGKVIFNILPIFTGLHYSLPLVPKPVTFLLIISVIFIFINICFTLINSMNYAGWTYDSYSVNSLDSESNNSTYKSTFNAAKSANDKTSFCQRPSDPILNYIATYKAKSLIKINKYVLTAILDQILMIISMITYCNNMSLSWWSPNDSLLLFFAFAILALCLINGSTQDIYDFF